MSKGYRHIQIHEEEMLELKAQGLTLREFGERFGLTREQTHPNLPLAVLFCFVTC